MLACRGCQNAALQHLCCEFALPFRQHVCVRPDPACSNNTPDPVRLSQAPCLSSSLKSHTCCADGTHPVHSVLPLVPIHPGLSTRNAWAPEPLPRPMSSQTETARLK